MEKEKVEQKLISLKEDYNKYRQTKPNETIVEQKIKHLYLRALNSSIDDTKDDLQNKIINLEEKRETLKQSQIQRKTVETLKDRQYSAFIKEQNRMEQKSNDEFALYGFIRTHERRWNSGDNQC